MAQTQAVLGDSRRVALGVVADPEAASRRMLAQAGGFRPQHSGWADEVRDAIAFRPRSWQDLEVWARMARYIRSRSAGRYRSCSVTAESSYRTAGSSASGRRRASLRQSA